MKLAADISACAGLTACTLTDLRSGTIPNVLLLIIIFISAITIGPDFLLRFFPALAIALLLFCLKRYGFPMVGGGDLKLFAVMFGWFGMDALLMIGAGLVVALIVAITKKKKKIILAPYMLIGFLIVKTGEMFLSG